MRWPVIIGALTASRSRTGRGRRTGQSCCIVSSCLRPVSSTQHERASRRRDARPVRPATSTRPLAHGGTSIDCGRGATVRAEDGTGAQRRRRPDTAELEASRATLRSATPGLDLEVRRRRDSGRSRPSKMPPSRSGPSVTDSGRSQPDDGHAGLEPGRVLVHLRDQFVAAQLDDFAEQAAFARRRAPRRC